MRKSVIARALRQALVILLISAQLFSPTVAAAMNQPGSAQSAPARGWQRRGNETREAFFNRVGKADPQRLQLAALRALETYLNQPAAANASADAFEQTIEDYLGLSMEALNALRPTRQVVESPSALAPPSPAPAPATTAAEAAAPSLYNVLFLQYLAEAPAPEFNAAAMAADAKPPAERPAAAASGKPRALTVLNRSIVASVLRASAGSAPAAPQREATTHRPSSLVPAAQPPAPAAAPVSAAITLAPNRETRTIGVVKITADQFTDLGGGDYRAEGSVVIGDYLLLTGVADVLTYNATSVSVNNVTLALQALGQKIDLFTGSFSANVGDGLASLGANPSYLLSQIAGFTIGSGLNISQINLADIAVTGSAALTLSPPGISTPVQANFTLVANANGIVPSGALQAFSLPVAGATLNVPGGATLSANGVLAPSVTLQMPALLGGLSAAVSNLKVTPSSLSIDEANATFNLPDIKIGDGSKLSITNIKAKLTLTNGHFELTATGSLQMNLPGNQKTIALTFKIDAQGNLSGTIGEVALNLAGATLSLKNATLDKDGVAVQNATITLPPALGGAGGSVGLVKITKDGLSFASVSFKMPNFTPGGSNVTAASSGPKLARGVSAGGSPLTVADPVATVGTTPNGYTLAISGKLQVRLPGNQKDINISASMDTAGNFSATVASLSLNIATLTLGLTNATVGNAGLSVGNASLALPSSLGGVSGSVSNVTINKDGLRIGGGVANIPFPDFKIGSAGAAGFAVTGAKAKIEITNNGTAYKVTLAGTVAISIPGSNASAAGVIILNSVGGLSGAINSFSLSVAGLSLSAQNVVVAADGSLSITSAKLVLPAGFGGGYIALNNVVIKRVTDASGTYNKITIGGGSFKLPDIKTGGFTLQLSGSLVKQGNGYLITANGVFVMPSLGAAVGCSGIQVGVKLYATANTQAVLEIEPATVAAASTSLDPGLAPDGLQLKEIFLSLSCSIPIGNTGFFLTSISGQVTLNENSTTVSVGIEIAAGKKFNGVALASVKGSATVVSNPFELALSGAVKVFTFTVAGATARVKPNQFYAKVWINVVVVKGQTEVWAWSDYKGFHLAGKATLEVGLTKGSILNECFNWYCCPNGKPYVGVNCWPWEVKTCKTCVKVPGSNIKVGNALAEVGEFKTPSNTTVWGLKGKVTVLGYTAAFYVDASGTIKVGGDVDKYKLVTPAQVLAAQERLAAARSAGLVAANADWTDAETGLIFTAPGEVLVPATLGRASQALFGLTRFGNAPGLELIRPDGLRITPNSLPAGVRYTEVSTYTVASELPNGPTDLTALSQPGAWKAPLGQALADLTPQLVAAAAAAGASSQPLFLANAFASRAGVGPVIEPAVCSENWAQQVTTPARLRLAYALAGVGPVNVTVDGAAIFTNIAYAAATPYISLAAGQHTLTILPVGATRPLLQQTVTLAGDVDHTALAAGAAGAATLTLLEDDNARPADGKARLRAVHAAPDAPAVDVANGEDLPFLFGLAPGEASAYVPLDAGVYDLRLQQAGFKTALATLPPTTLAEGRVYTLFLIGQMAQAAGATTPAALQAVLSQDAAPPGRVRFIHASQDHGTLSLLADGVPLFVGVPYTIDAHGSAVTQYAELPPGSHQFAVITPTAPGAPLSTLALDVASDMDYTLVATPGQLWVADIAALVSAALAATDPARVDDNSVPALGQARVRLLHAWSDTRAIQLAIRNGAALTPAVGQHQASDYISLAAATYNLQVRDAATGAQLTLLLSIPLQEGVVYTVLVRDGNPRVDVVRDMVAQKTTQMQYEVDAPARGEWKAALTGNFGVDDQYLLSITASIPDTMLSDVAVAPGADNSGQLSWRLSSAETNTAVSVFANPGPIQTTVVVTGTGGVTETQTVPLYTGFPLAEGLTDPSPTWIDGTTTHQLNLNLNDLASGVYHIWMQADDGRTRPDRAYAATPITVSHLWQTTWNAGLTLAPGYRRLDAAWNRHPNPDVDRFVLKLQTQSTVAGLGLGPAAIQEVDAGDSRAYAFTGLNPEETYTLWLEGVDSETGRVSTSERVIATPAGAAFTLTGPAGVTTIRSGSARTVALTLATTDPAYPDSVLLTAGCESAAELLALAEGAPASPSACQPLPDGISVTFSQEVITPTVAGVQVNAEIAAVATLADGLYAVPIQANGGGVERTLAVQVQAQQPAFQLSGPAGVVLNANGSISVTIGVTPINGAADPVELTLLGAPAGLQWQFQPASVVPGGQTTLLLTHTGQLPRGGYPLVVAGSDGRVGDELALALTVREPAFVPVTLPSLQYALVGQAGTAVYQLQLGAQDGWNLPVTLTLPPGSAPPHGVAVLSLTPNPESGQSSLTITPPARAFLIVTWGEQTPAGLYLFDIQAQGGGQTRQMEAALNVIAEPHTYLPMMLRR
ncbi:MAG: DUF4397 domain-containing protein [Caldilineales bacterium]|nr:DUF4397 domain-containing protein [Caldilineales bacterium]